MDVAVGQDQVLFGISLPSDCVLNGLTAEVHVLGQNVIAATFAVMYGIEGYILPVLDPDSAPSFNTIWDTLVPKDNDTDTIDLDTGASDTSTMFEPGEMALEEVMDLGLQPERIYNLQRLKTIANGALRQEEAGVLEWVTADIHKIRIGKRYRVKEPSVVLFGLGNADLSDTTAALAAALSEAEWPRVKYMETVLEQALMKHMGLVEAGAETPWEEAASLLRSYLEPDVYEEDAAAWQADVFRVFSNVTFDVSVPGQMDKIQLGTGG